MLITVCKIIINDREREFETGEAKKKGWEISVKVLRDTYSCKFARIFLMYYITERFINTALFKRNYSVNIKNQGEE